MQIQSVRPVEAKQATWVVTAFRWALAAFSAFWISVPFAIQMLSILAGVDVVSSMFNPNRNLLKLCKRIALTFILVATVHYVYSLAKNQAGLNVGFDIATIVSSFYCLGEIIAILKNCSEAGLPLPPALLDTISRAEGLTGRDRSELNALKLKQADEHTALNLKQSKEDTALETKRDKEEQ